MKTLQYINNKWNELKDVPLSEAQQAVLDAETDIKAVQEVYDYINTNKSVVASKEDASKAQDKYDLIKPIIKDTDAYELISFFITMDNYSSYGILSYKLNGILNQKRF